MPFLLLNRSLIYYAMQKCKIKWNRPIFHLPGCDFHSNGILISKEVRMKLEFFSNISSSAFACSTAIFPRIMIDKTNGPD